MKKIRARQLILKKYSCYGLKKNSCKEFDNEKKIAAARKFPFPHNFSNGPSLILSFLGRGAGDGQVGCEGEMGGHFIFRRIEGGIIRICEPKKDIINEEELELRIQKDDSNLLDNASLRAYNFFPCFLVQ